MAKITPHLWYAKDADEAARFYVSLLPDSRIDSVQTIPAETPSGPAGTVTMVSFTLAGQPFSAIAAGPLDSFNHAVSFMVDCDDQAEVDRIWDAIVEHGGTPEQCGWIRDRYGLCWQIVPRDFRRLMSSPDRAGAKRVAEAMLKMVKFDVAALQRAYDGA
jgi:predicted 3-demethylubiquinone-9 3-methyltransferase (glyoxalase superfamily)